MPSHAAIDISNYAARQALNFGKNSHRCRNRFSSDNAHGQESTDAQADFCAAITEKDQPRHEQRIADLGAQLLAKEADLQQEQETVLVSAKTVKALRDTVTYLRRELEIQTDSAIAQHYEQLKMRVSDLQNELQNKNYELQDELERVELLGETIRVLREELQKQSTELVIRFTHFFG